MHKTNRWLGRAWIRSISWLAVAAIYAGFSAMATPGQERAVTTNDASGAKTTARNNFIPAGTVLPVILRTTIAPEKIKQGQTIDGEIAQEVPLPGGAKIPKGSKVEGHIVEVTPSGNGTGTKVSLRFDKVHSHGHAIPVVTDLRALAGFMEVQGAGLPDLAAGEGEVVRWSTTTQVGGIRSTVSTVRCRVLKTRRRLWANPWMAGYSYKCGQRKEHRAGDQLTATTLLRPCGFFLPTHAECMECVTSRLPTRAEPSLWERSFSTYKGTTQRLEARTECFCA